MENDWDVVVAPGTGPSADRELDALDAEWNANAQVLAWVMVAAGDDGAAVAAAGRFLPRLRELRDKKAALLRWGGEEER